MINCEEKKSTVLRLKKKKKSNLMFEIYFSIKTCFHFNGVFFFPTQCVNFNKEVKILFRTVQ